MYEGQVKLFCLLSSFLLLLLFWFFFYVEGLGDFRLLYGKLLLLMFVSDVLHAFVVPLTIAG